MSKVALVTGVLGQDGTLLAADLIKDGYFVYGLTSLNSPGKDWRLKAVGIAGHPKLKMLTGDITNPHQVLQIIEDTKPAEIFNLASHSFVQDSFTYPHDTALVTGVGPLNILEAVSKVSPKSRVLQASSSEMFGLAKSSPQDEFSSFAPRNIYGSAKLFAHWSAIHYTTSKNIFAASAILFNHESYLRGLEFVTRKITNGVANIKLGQSENLEIGNLSSVRDWGYAPEYVSGMRSIISWSQPEVFVLATGRATTVRQFVAAAFEAIDIGIEFSGVGLDEIGFDKNSGRELVKVDSGFYRESEEIPLVGNPSKANSCLGWEAKTHVGEIARKMVDHELGVASARE